MAENKQIEILLVEDDPNDVELTLRALNRHKLANKVHVVKDGAEALEFIFCRGAYAGRPDCENLKLILLDLKLPKVNGLEVLRAVKTDEKKKIIPVVVLTSSQEESDLIKSYHLGANSYIVKPVDFPKFIEAVSQLGYYWLLLNHTL
ncbi:MAG: response regulator [Candidatus Omnitrophota bacterium]